MSHDQPHHAHHEHNNGQLGEPNPGQTLPVVKSAEPVEYVQKEGSAANTIRLTAEYAKTQPIAAEDIHPTSSSNQTSGGKRKVHRLQAIHDQPNLGKVEMIFKERQVGASLDLTAAAPLDLDGKPLLVTHSATYQEAYDMLVAMPEDPTNEANIALWKLVEEYKLKQQVAPYPPSALFFLKRDKPEQQWLIPGWYIRNLAFATQEYPRNSPNSYMDRFVMLLIMSNCVTMAIQKEMSIGGHTSTDTYKVLEEIEVFYLVCFTLEMIIKIVVWGLFCHKHSYVRDPWSWVDLLCVTGGWIGFGGGSFNPQWMRTIRVLRPLRSLNRVAGMRRLVTCLLKSVPPLANVAVVMCFFFVVFGILGVQLFKGSLHYSCRRDICDANSTVPCGQTSCPEDGTLADNNCEWAPSYPNICNPAATDWASGHKCSCFDFGEADGCDGGETNTQISCAFFGKGTEYDFNAADNFYGNPNSDINHFDTFGYAFVSIFQAISLEGWVDMMWFVQDGYSGWVWLYFYMLIFFGSFFVVNLFLAVLCDSFEDSEEDEEEESSEVGKEGLETDEPEGDDHIPVSVTGLRRTCWEIIVGQKFQFAVVFLIILNTVLMASEYSDPQLLMDTGEPMAPAWTAFLEVANTVLTIVFCVESAFKLAVFQPKHFIKDEFNIFDFVVCVLSLSEVIIGLYGLSIGNMSVLRTFRLLRVFKLARNWTGLLRILKTLMESVRAVVYLILILLLVMFIFSLLGMELFGGKLGKAEERPRTHMDGLGWAFISIFCVLSGENWNELMFDYKAILDEGGEEGDIACVYFLVLFTVGNYVVMNLFIAILLSKFGPTEEEEAERATKAKMLSASMLQFATNGGDKPGRGVELITVSTNDVERPGEYEDPTEEKSLSDLKKYPPFPDDSPEDKSMFIFNWTNPVRRKCAVIVNYPQFDYAVVVLILISSLCLALDQPIAWDGLTPPTKAEVDAHNEGALKQALHGMDIFFTVIFTFEMLMKIISMGFVGPKGQAYLRNGWNVLDFCIVMVSIISLAVPSNSDNAFLGALKSLRTLRALRPLRLVSRAPGLKQVVNALFSAVPAVKDVVVVAFLFMSIWAILGVQLFAGKFGSCGAIKDDVYYYDLAISTIKGCKGTFETDDGVFERQWVNPAFGDFDNYWHALLLLFEVAGLEGWPNVMFHGMDVHPSEQGVAVIANCEDANMSSMDIQNNEFDNSACQLTRDSKVDYSLFFVSWIVMGAFFVLNMVVGCVIDKFDEVRSAESGALLMTPEQGEWVSATRVMIALRPLKSVRCPWSVPWRRKLFTVVTDYRFDVFIMGCIILNVFIMALDGYNNAQWLTDVSDVGNYWIFLIIFTIEAVLKLVAFGPRIYYKDPWNSFDFTLVLISWIDFVFKYSGQPMNVKPTLPRVLRVFRVVRILRIVKTAKTLRQLLVTLYTSFPALGNVGFLLFLVMFIYAIMGMQLFSHITYDGDRFIHRHANFDSFFRAMDLLFRCSTGESWNGLMHDCWKKVPAKPWLSTPPTEGTWLSLPYFLSYTLIAAFIMLNLVIGVILENFSNQTIGSISMEQLEEYRDIWLGLDPQGTYSIATHELPLLIQKLHAPLGLYDENNPPNRTDLFTCLRAIQVPNHEGRIDFHETLMALANRVGGTHLPHCALTKKLNSNILTMGKRDKLPVATTSVEEYYAVAIVQASWRGYVARSTFQEPGATMDGNQTQSGSGGEPAQATKDKNGKFIHSRPFNSSSKVHPEAPTTN